MSAKKSSNTRASAGASFGAKTRIHFSLAWPFWSARCARRWIHASAGVLALSVLGGCVDYLEHRDTITLRAGDAQAWNKTVHTTDPWPPYVMNNHIPGDGQRTAAVIQRYSTGNAGPVDGFAAAGATAETARPAQ